MPVVFQDERYSTKAVEKHLIAADVSRKKRKEVVDSLAAAFILEGYLAKQNLS
jgi:putative Holliday junction resolvase